MNGKIIIYDRENYKQDSKNYLLDSFCDVLESENLLDFRGLFFEAKSHCLNYL